MIGWSVLPGAKPPRRRISVGERRGAMPMSQRPMGRERSIVSKWREARVKASFRFSRSIDAWGMMWWEEGLVELPPKMYRWSDRMQPEAEERAVLRSGRDYQMLALGVYCSTVFRALRVPPWDALCPPNAKI